MIGRKKSGKTRREDVRKDEELAEENICTGAGDGPEKIEGESLISSLVERYEAAKEKQPVMLNRRCWIWLDDT